jgi:UDP-N-acetylglucosamine--N-acetylmuramyl-(pentapeptide) pyrophosphoryl-undecaprenol N-acetylglucosamine transferase
VAEALRSHRPAVELYFVGSVEGIERSLVEKSGLVVQGYDAVQAGQIHGINPLRAAVNVGRLAVGVMQSMRLMQQRRPHAVLSTGGWVSFPVAVAARLTGVPLVIYLPDIEPALTIKSTQPLAEKVAVTTEASAAYVPADKMIVTGYPLRQQVSEATRALGIEHFDLDPLRKTLLVFGGSLGSRNINAALIDILPHLLSRDDLQVIHVTGERDWERAQAQIRDRLPTGATRYHVFPYLHETMGLAYAAADLALCRSGASTLGELPYFHLPAILVPYPYAWRYQKVNADYLSERGAAVIMPDEDMNTSLLETIEGLLDDPARLAEMRDHTAALARPDAADRIAGLLFELSGEPVGQHTGEAHL